MSTSETSANKPGRKPWNKRRMALGALAAGALGAALLRPRDAGAPHGSYFKLLTDALRLAGMAQPVLLIDKNRLLANQTAIRHHMTMMKQPMALRLVAKSLPCQALLDSLILQMRTPRLMVFNLPYLQHLAALGEKAVRPDLDILLGKPLPAAAAARFYREMRGAFDDQRQLQWLIDSPARLTQYQQLAQQQKRRLRVNLELDVGLRRGGFADLQALGQVLEQIRKEPLLEFSGMMGYDAHIPKLPLQSLRDDALAHAKKVYQDALQLALQTLKPAHGGRDWTLNAAGSPTYRLHDGSGAANEVAIGSAFVKPGDFDTPLLQELKAACYIATPVLKAGREFAMPYGVQALGGLARAWDPNSNQAYFIYGGQWLAEPVSPAGLSASTLYGTSSNQQMLQGSGAQGLQVDDWVFFRPRQSEALFSQFGAIALFDTGRITDFWPVWPAQA
ncbi:alanine racemase [Massilia sp. W12]|uniref:alanine racemase n=1 Tax=Massilia sp. W12 TaxID=3126507 RepID=UPI0030CEE6A4